MSGNHNYLSIEDTLALHYLLIEKFGGQHGLMNLEALESAIMRPKSGYYGTLIEESAAIFQSLWTNHPFIDGNKRLAVAALDVFLRINGVKLKSNAVNLLTDLQRMESLMKNFPSLCLAIKSQCIEIGNG